MIRIMIYILGIRILGLTFLECLKPVSCRKTKARFHLLISEFSIIATKILPLQSGIMMICSTILTMLVSNFIVVVNGQTLNHLKSSLLQTLMDDLQYDDN